MSNMSKADFFDLIRVYPFGGKLSQSAVDGIEAILLAWDIYGDGDERKLAYILATAFYESDRFRTMEEYASGHDYEGRKDLGNTKPGDGARFKGRGFVQLTGRRNYQDWSNRLGIDLIENPERVEERDIAARILVEGMMLGTFTGKPLGNYIGNDKTDFYNARRVVNGTDRADLIADYAESFLDALTEAAEEPSQPPPPVPDPPPPLSLEERVAVLEAIVARLEANNG